MELKAGDHIHGGKYEILGVLGQGGMAVVYKARDHRFPFDDGHDHFVAIKTLKANATDQLRQLFIREARIMARLPRHPNIVSILDWALEDRAGEQLAYLVMELLGKDLTKANLTANMPRALKVARDVCAAVAYAHEKEIIHRDIKPSNLLWSCDDAYVRVADFGLAKDLETETADYTAQAWGSLPYMAPEQFTNGYSPDKRSDTYQLGVTLYELLTGDLPFAGDDAAVLRRKIQGATPDPPKSRNDHVPKAVSDLVVAMLAKKPEERPVLSGTVQTVLKEALDHALACRQGISEETLVQCPVTLKIRKALVSKIRRVIDDFAQPDRSFPAVPRQREDPDWYATVLLRASQDRADGTSGPARKFHPIYFAHFKRGELFASSDWIRSPHLLTHPLRIEECCSGLPIRWCNGDCDWVDKPVNKDLFDCRTRDDDRIMYFVLRNVEDARFAKEKILDNIIRETYATDNIPDGADAQRAETNHAVGWDLTRAENDQERVPMRQDIQAEILVPIYDPSAKRPFGPDDILGVANFEWVQGLSPKRESEIGEALSDRIQEGRRFPISRFTCDVLQHVTTPDR